MAAHGVMRCGDCGVLRSHNPKQQSMESLTAPTAARASPLPATRADVAPIAKPRQPILRPVTCGRLGGPDFRPTQESSDLQPAAGARLGR